MPTIPEWVERGKTAIVALLEREHAAVWPEIEAKLAEGPGRVDPHHLTRARIRLLSDLTIEVVEAPTRGGKPVSVFALTDRIGRQRAFEDAAARKRLLYTRYINWSSRYYGRAGERAAHASLLAAAPQAGYRLFEPHRGQVSTIFGQPVPVGPLDNGGTLQLVDAQGRPTGSVAILVEVKNIHQWMYPSTDELYQLLEKATQLQAALPDVDFVPVMVCRRGHPTVFRMAKDLGFFIADARAQYVLPVADVPEEHVAELRAELGMIDLVRPVVDPRFPDRWGPYVSKRLVKLFADDLPPIAQRTAARFKLAAPVLSQFAPALKTARPGRAQATLMAALRRAAASLRTDGGW
jgi:hypothetical protein